MAAIYVLSRISDDNTLLTHFINYYKSIGVEKFIICIDDRVSDIWPSTVKLVSEFQATIKLVPMSEIQKHPELLKNDFEEMRRRFISSDDWIIPVDLDEFIHFPVPLAQIILNLGKVDATFITGRLSDRLAPDGCLSSANEKDSIWNQYPLEAKVSLKLGMSPCTKITLARGDCVLAVNGHVVIYPHRPLILRNCVIHCFKWRRGLQEALERRVITYKADRLSSYVEAERILLYLQTNGRIVLEDFDAKQGWTPSLNNSKKITIIYTAIANQYDELRNPCPNNSSISEFVAFTDSEQSSNTWKVLPIHNRFWDPCRNAKIHKILPHIYFPDAEYSLWIDGSVFFKPHFSITKMIETYLVKHDIAVFAHNKRTCIYAEAGTCIVKNKDDPEIIGQQMITYKSDGYPSNNGLAECTILLRRHTKKIQVFNELWWTEIQNHSRRDQLSFNYVTWKLNLSYCEIPGTVRNANMFFGNIKHNERLR